MRLPALLLMLYVSVSFGQSSGKVRTVLFIGNSYTFFNNLPQLVQELAKASGDSLIVDSYAPGGYTFNNHANDPSCLAKIQSKNWDFVVLQAQSQEPSFSPAQVNAQTLPYALKLDSLIKANNACSQTVFFETWGRKYGDASNCAAYPPVCTYTGMQNRLKQSYKLFADLTSGIMAPAGEAFRESMQRDPNVELYNSDQSHPSLEGSYLSAAVFYESLFQRSVLSNTYISSLSPTLASFLQDVAHEVVHDSLEVWNLGANYPWAGFDTSFTGPVALQFHSVNSGLSELWYFGDGSFTSGSSPSHTYTSGGTFVVSHVMFDNCAKDSVSKTLNISWPVGLNEALQDEDQFFYPHPAQDYLYLPGNQNGGLKLFSLLGQLVLETEIVPVINLRDIPDGLYLLQLESDSATSRHSLLVQRRW